MLCEIVFFLPATVVVRRVQPLSPMMLFSRRLFSTRLPRTIHQLLSSADNTTHASSVRVSGWVKSVRRQKNVAFAVITDGSSSNGLQAVFTDVTAAKQCVLPAHGVQLAQTN